MRSRLARLAPLAALALALAAAPLAAQQAAAPAAPATAAAPAEGGGLPALPPEQVSGSYALDPEHSHIVWSYSHMGFSTSSGLVRGVTGKLVLDNAEPSKSSVEVSFPMSALWTVSAMLDQHIMGDDFFKGIAPDTAVTFRSTAVEPTGERSARVTGDLTLNGVTKPVTLETQLNLVAVDPVANRPKAGLTATGTLKRSDFNLGAFAPAVGDEVALTIGIEAMKE